jgi:hypothetical protein
MYGCSRSIRPAPEGAQVPPGRVVPFAVGTVAGVAVAALSVPIAYAGEWEPFAVGVGTAALVVIGPVVNPDEPGRPNPAPQRTSVPVAGRDS